MAPVASVGTSLVVSFGQTVDPLSLVRLAISSPLRAMQRSKAGLASLGNSSLSVADADALGHQTAQERLAGPFSRSLVVLIGGALQGVRQAPWHAQAKLFRLSCDWYLRELRRCRGSVSTTFHQSFAAAVRNESDRCGGCDGCDGRIGERRAL